MVRRLMPSSTDAPEITVHPAFTRLTSSKETSRNVTLQLNCNVTGNPLPMVVWSKMPRGLDHWENVSDKWVFVVKRAVTNDSGTYRCMAWNDLGHKFSNLAQVFVQGQTKCIYHIFTNKNFNFVLYYRASTFCPNCPNIECHSPKLRC